jgi:hypothetical protein
MSSLTHKKRILSPYNSRTKPSRPFAGFAAPTSNTTFAPNQFFDACLPYHSRGVVRLVAYLIRKTLGWCDTQGNPQEEQISVSYRELITKAGISRDMIRQALNEAVAGHFIECVHEGRANSTGEVGQSACYQLRWDASPEYRKKPADFRGFYELQGNRTDIPNEFFDVIVPNEPLSVIKAVGSVIRFSIGFQAKHGRRRQQVALSYKEIERYARIGSPTDLSKALRTALEKNYLVRLEPGVFSHRSDERKPAIYAVRWADDWHGQKNIAALDTSEIRSSHGQKNEAAERSEIRSSIQTKPENETNKQQVAPQTKAAELLKRTGFGAKAAIKLAESAPLETIERQIEWLKDRAPSRNRLGLLRKAIEENWSEPMRVGTSQLVGNPGYVFAQHFYAAFSGNHADPVNEPSLRDCEAAGNFLNRLNLVNPEVSASESGRALGKLAREQRNPFPSLQLGLRQLGDRLFVRVKVERKQAERETLENERRTILQTLESEYERFLRGEEEQIKSTQPEGYASFLDHRANEREKLARHPLWSRSPRWLELFDADQRRLSDLQRFFRVPDFAKWHSSHNSTPQT